VSIEVTCECGKQYRVRDDLAGRRVSCPACKTEIHVPLPPALAQIRLDQDDDPDSVPSAPPVPKVPAVTAVSNPTTQQSPAVQIARSTDGVALAAANRDAFRAIQTIALTLLLLMFGWVAASHLDRRHYAYGRFENDNAIGATANMISDIRRTMPMDAPAWFIAALLCWLIMAVNRLRWKIQDRG
jgi:hypothetical protein